MEQGARQEPALPSWSLQSAGEKGPGSRGCSQGPLGARSELGWSSCQHWHAGPRPVCSPQRGDRSPLTQRDRVCVCVYTELRLH